LRKIIFLGMVVALLGALIVPALASPATAEAWTSCSPRVDCNTTYLEIAAIKGVNPDAKTIGVSRSKGTCGTLWWTVSDNAGWLSVSPSFGTNNGETDLVKLNINSKNLAVGEYCATIKVANLWRSSDYKTIEVWLLVAEPVVKGPIMIGMEGIWPWSPDYVYDGTSANLRLMPCGFINPDGTEYPCGFEDLGDAAIEVKDCWHMSLNVDLTAGMITGGALSGNGGLPSGQIIGGQIQSLSALLPGFDLGDNYIISLMIDAGDQGILNYAGMLLSDIDGLLAAIPNLMSMLSSSSASSTGIEAQNQGVVIPLGPIMDILPKLLPMMEDLLPKLLPLIKPIAGLIPPVIVIMPGDLLVELMSLLMP